MQHHPLNQRVIAIKSAGEQASAIACRLFNANIRKIFMLETSEPVTVRRTVAFCEALHEEQAIVEDVKAVQISDKTGIQNAWDDNCIPVLADPDWRFIPLMKPDVVVDAILAKRNLGTRLDEAPLVIALGPGFYANVDTHIVIETKRGHNLGRVIQAGAAAPNTGQPGNIAGYTVERVLRAPVSGFFTSERELGEKVKCDELIGYVNGHPIRAAIDGMIRGLIRPGRRVPKGMKLGDIDPRADAAFLDTISDKGRAIGGAVLEAILMRYN